MGKINGTLQSCTWFTVYGDVLLVISPMLAAFIAIILMYFLIKLNIKRHTFFYYL